MRSATIVRRVVLPSIGVFIFVAVGSFSYKGLAGSVLAAPTITAKPTNPAATTSASFSFNGPNGASFQCQLDTSPTFAACTSPKSYASLSQGTHTFQVRALSSSTQSSATNYTWTVDTVAPPAPVLTTKPADPTANATNTFAWTTLAGNSYQCSTENGAWTTCSSPYTYLINTTNNGQHQFAVRALDAAGNASAGTFYQYKYEKGQPTSGMPFQITGTVSGLTLGVWKPITVTITNPNSAVIYVSALNVTVAADSTPSGCLSSANVELQQSNISTSLTVAVPANGSVTLPVLTATAPQIRLKNLATVNQDTCKGKSFNLTYSGSATN